MADMVDDYNSSGSMVAGVFTPYSETNKPPQEALEPPSLTPDDPFASLSESMQKSLADAGITTVEQAKALGKDGLVALPNIGEKTATDILAL